jgi:hypothetical protein
MLAATGNVIVEASEAWPVVAAGLGSAVIVALATLLVAGKQRHADSDRLDRQLDYDRKMRHKQQGIDAARFEQQLAHDTKMRQRQNDAESSRLTRQLAHDREMRDLQHLRETLAPIVARLVNWDAFLSLHVKLAIAGDEDEQQQVIAELANQVGDVSEQLRRDSRTLVILAGPTAPVALRLKEVANDGDELIHFAWTWKEQGTLTPEERQALDALLAKYGHDHTRFVEAANEVVRWGPSPDDEQEAMGVAATDATPRMGLMKREDAERYIGGLVAEAVAAKRQADASTTTSGDQL